MRLRLILVAVIVATLSGLLAPDASADSGAAVFKYGIGGPAAGPDFSFLTGPPRAMADNGDTVAISGHGTLSVHAKAASGGGTFTHRNAAGKVLVSGTWTARDLLSFNSYGTSPGLPAIFEGGAALIRVHLTPAAGGPGFDAILTVACLVGKPPAGAAEGVRLNVQDVLNFNKTVAESGQTLFIRQ
jgi:hypothetical protein